MAQQTRNVKMRAEEQGIDIRFLLHDHDTKFTEEFNEAFKREDGGVVKTSIMAPIANCFLESWIGSFKRECLNHLFCWRLTSPLRMPVRRCSSIIAATGDSSGTFWISSFSSVSFEPAATDSASR